MNLRAAVASLLFLPNLVSAQDNCVDIERLGTPTLDRFDYSISMDVDNDCEFVLKITFKHDENLPLPTNPSAQCDFSIVPPEMAVDGIPYYGDRWFYQTVPNDIKEVTGIDHVSIDWNSCGHPPLNIFGAPLYDFHLYRETPEFRTCMTCTPVPGDIICDPTPGTQTTPNGLAFFNVTTVNTPGTVGIQRVFDPAAQPINMPEDYVVAIDQMIPLMSGHAWDPKNEPTSSLEWEKPVFALGPYAGGLVNYAPVIPLSFMVGDVNHEHSEILSYVDQTIDELPSSFTGKYDAKTKMVTFTLTGSSAPGSCEEKVEVPIEDHVDEDHSNDMDEDMTDSGSGGVLLSLVFSVTSIVMPSLLLL